METKVIYNGEETKLTINHTVKHLSELTKTPNKFIEHVKYYLSNKPPDYPNIDFKDDFTKIIIY